MLVDVVLPFPADGDRKQRRSSSIQRKIFLQQYSEGSWFAEIYTAPFTRDDRPLAGSIYFLPEKDETSHVVVPAGAFFAAENIDKNRYTFILCMTTPRFVYKGFRVIPRDEVKKLYLNLPEKILRLICEKV